MEGLYVKVLVGKRLKKYIMDSYRSDTIPLERDSVLLHIIRPYLELSSASEEDPLDDETLQEEVVKIELPNENRKVYHQSGRKVYVCNTLWRNVLSKKGQDKVKRFFDKNFKKAFRTYMDGYIEHQHITMNDDQYHMNVKDGVVAFLMQYHIDFTEKDIAAFERDWYRHRDRTEDNRISPLIY